MDATTTAIAVSAGLAAFVLALVSLIKPLLEVYVPAFHPNAPLHDNLLRLVNIVLQVLVVIVYTAWVQHDLTGANVGTYIFQSLAQAIGADITYKHVIDSGLSVGADGLSSSGEMAFTPSRGMDTGALAQHIATQIAAGVALASASQPASVASTPAATPAVTPDAVPANGVQTTTTVTLDPTSETATGQD